MINTLFFQILQYSIGVLNDNPMETASKEWHLLYKIAQQQSVLGILFFGIQRASTGKPDKKLLLKWYVANERIRQNNKNANKAAVEITHLFRKQGFRTCILKGQGNTLNYPNPYIRTSGDVDVWVEGGHRKILNWMQGHIEHPKFMYHHVKFKPVYGVAVEVHYRPSFMNNLIHNRRMQRWFESVADEQFRHVVELPDGAGSVCVPTNAFNRIYQMSHIANHFFQEGIGFRQILDYYYLLRQGFTEEERAHDEQLLKYLGLYNLTSAVMYVLQEAFDMESELLLVPANEKLGKFVMDEILQAGNFGQHDRRVKHRQGRWARSVQRLKRDMYLAKYFPSECLWEPVFRVWHWCWRHRLSLIMSKRNYSAIISKETFS